MSAEPYVIRSVSTNEKLAFRLFGKKPETQGPAPAFSFESTSVGDSPEPPATFSDPAARMVSWSERLAPRDVKFEAPSLQMRRELLERFEGNIGKVEDETTKVLITDYKQSRDPRKLEQLYGLYQPSLDRMISQAAYGRLPEPAVRAKTYTAFKQAVENYDPDHGKRFYNYFADNQFRTAQNSFRPYSNFRKVVHQRAANLDAVDKITKDLELQHGQAPTSKEIGLEYQKLYGKTLREGEIKTMLKELAPEHMRSAELDNSYMSDTTNQMYIASLRAKDAVPGSEKALFEALFLKPLEGGVAPTQKEIAKKFNMSPATLNRRTQDYRNNIMREYNVLTRG